MHIINYDCIDYLTLTTFSVCKLPWKHTNKPITCMNQPETAIRRIYHNHFINIPSLIHRNSIWFPTATCLRHIDIGCTIMQLYNGIHVVSSMWLHCYSRKTSNLLYRLLIHVILFFLLVLSSFLSTRSQHRAFSHSQFIIFSCHLI